MLSKEDDMDKQTSETTKVIDVQVLKRQKYKKQIVTLM